MAADRLTIRTKATHKVGIVHFGPGAFFRAFVGVYTDDLLRKRGGDWAICGVSLRSSTYRDQLVPQGCAYTAVEHGPGGTTARIITSLLDVVVAPDSPETVLDLLADPATKIVSLTITEKGYCHEPATGFLRRADPDIKAELSGGPPRTALGYIVAALARRKSAGLRPFTVMSCDNLPQNGKLTRRVILDFAQARDPELAHWIATEGRFPCTMVDRITPATTTEDTTRLQQSEGYFDPANVQHEPFRQWVIEDDFVDGQRPDWASVGAQFVDDVEPYEHMKLRCLNGAHSALAYLGYLAGYKTVADAVSDETFTKFCKTLWHKEILPTVPQPPGEDLPAYCDALLNRFRNPAIRHLTWQIAMDGSQKLPQRILAPLTENLDAGRPTAGLTLAVAAWMRYVGGIDETGKPIDVRDPMADRLAQAVADTNPPADRVKAMLNLSEIFPTQLAQNPEFQKTLIETYTRMCAIGALASVKAYVAANSLP